MTTILWFLVVLGILIFVHEFGHFVMAKLFNVYVDRFSLGFGPKLLSFTRGETEYCMSAFPLGGYVRMAGQFDLPEEYTDEETRAAFAHVPEKSPYDNPQRRLCVGLYSGVRDATPRGVTLSVSPGHGELIEIPTLTFSGMATALLMENVPGGDLAKTRRPLVDGVTDAESRRR